MKTATLPSLSENTFLRYFNFVALYFAQGIPEGMLSMGIPAWLAVNGKSPAEIASFAIVMVLPWSFKFVVAPMMDRYTLLSMGRKRPWILFGQFGLVASCIYMAYVPDPLNNLDHLMAAGFMVSFFGAFQDVATDGMAIDIIPTDQQAKANGLMWGSKIIGMSASLAVGSLILNKYNFTTAMLTMAIVIGAIMLVPMLLRERHGEKIMPWTHGEASHETMHTQVTNWGSLFKSLFKVFRLRNSLLITALLFICQGSFKYLTTLLPIFTVKELGWTSLDYSNYYSTAKLIGGIVGMLIGGILIDRFGKKQMMTIYFLLAIAVNCVFCFSKIYWGEKGFIYGFMIVQNTIYTVSCIGVFAMAMECCWKKVSASQFTLYMTIANMGQMAFVALIGPIKDNVSWQVTLFAFSAMIASAIIVMHFLDLKQQIQKVAELEQKESVPLIPELV